MQSINEAFLSTVNGGFFAQANFSALIYQNLAPVLGGELLAAERPIPEPLPWQNPVVVPQTTALNPLLGNFLPS